MVGKLIKGRRNFGATWHGYPLRNVSRQGIRNGGDHGPKYINQNAMKKRREIETLTAG